MWEKVNDYDVVLDNGTVVRVQDVGSERLAKLDAVYRYSTSHMFDRVPRAVEIRRLDRGKWERS